MNSKEFWPFVLFIGLLLFNWPLLHIFGGALPLYLMTAWGGFILALGLFVFLINRKRSAD